MVKPEVESAQSLVHQYIPKELLTKLETARTRGIMVGDRRIVTILFSDVKGSTAAAEKLDPEEWAEIMNGAFRHLIAPVYRYEGTLARLMGDAILAFFGAPIAHEDDPQRAVLAGLDIIGGIRSYREEVKRRWGLDFDVRVGINTGLVVVGEVGSDLRMEYTALGDTVNVASRMEQSAKPGTVQIAGDTYKLVAPLFEFDDLGGIEVKGKSEPVHAYLVLRPKAEPGSLRGIEGLDAPLVGREREMKILRDAISNLRQGRGQIVSVMGEAGLGKSRLIAELSKALASEGLPSVSKLKSDQGARGTIGTAIAWYEGRSLSYESSTPYAPFVNLFKSCFGLQAEETDGGKYNRVRAYVSELTPERVEEIAPFIATMLGIKLTGEDAERVRYLEPPHLRGRVFKATFDLFDRLSGMMPIIVVFEDLHWADPTSLDLIEQLMPLADRAPIAIVCLFRPWRQEASWRFHEVAARDYIHRYTQIVLEPLGQEDSRALVANLLHIEDLPEKVRKLVLTKAEGNPFFIEEVIRSLLDAKLVVRENSHWRATREIENIAIPDTLAGVITARLDRLGEEPKRVVQTASVIGREFGLTALADVHGAREVLNVALSDLQRRELIRERSSIPERVYTFKHALTQEAAYASLLLSKRRELHRRVAECLEGIAPESVNDIARHFTEAKEPARALPYLVKAGDLAARSYSTAEAIGLYTQAISILETQKDLQLTRHSYEGLGGVLTFAHEVPRAVENYRKMLRIAQAENDLPMQVSALNKLGFVAALMQGQIPEAERHLVDAERLANQCADRAGLAELHMTYCYIRTSTGNFDDAVTHLKEAAQIGSDLNLEEARLFGLTHTANTLAFMTRFDDAWQAAGEARRVAEEVGNRRYLAELLTFTIPSYHLRNGDLEEARQAAEEGVNIAAEIGAADHESTGAYMLGQLAEMRGEHERAVMRYERALGAGRTAGMPFLQSSALCGLGTAYLGISEDLLNKATEFHAQALKIMEMPLGAAMGAMNWAEIGFCAMAAGNIEGAKEFFQKGLTTPSAPIHMLRPKLLVGSALVALARNNLDEAARLIHVARGFAEAGAMKHYYPLVELTDAKVSMAQGKNQQALGHFTRAEGLALDMKMRPPVWQARAGAAQVLSALGRRIEAEEKRRQAREVIDEIAGLFQDEKLRTMYLDSATKKLA